MPSLFESRGIMHVILLSGKQVVIRPDKTLGQQIIVCGVLLVLQLVGSKICKSRLFDD